MSYSNASKNLRKKEMLKINWLMAPALKIVKVVGK